MDLLRDTKKFMWLYEDMLDKRDDLPPEWSTDGIRTMYSSAYSLLR